MLVSVWNQRSCLQSSHPGSLRTGYFRCSGKPCTTRSNHALRHKKRRTCVRLTEPVAKTQCVMTWDVWVVDFGAMLFACLRCSSRVGKVCDVKLFTSESFAVFDSVRNSLTSFVWSVTMSFMYARSKESPDNFSSLALVAASLALSLSGRVTPFSLAICFS